MTVHDLMADRLFLESDMDNPWVNLPHAAPYVLPTDRDAINAFNHRARPEHMVHLELLPEPFLGAPTSPVVLLSLNPGYSPDDLQPHQDPTFQALSRASLEHAPTRYPFLLLNPEIEAPGRRWWESKLARLIEARGRETVARNVLCVEYFPYHSYRFAHGTLQVPSHAYSIRLVREALQRRALIVAMRAERIWRQAIPELADYPDLYRLRNPQNVVISERNCPEGYATILSALT